MLSALSAGSVAEQIEQAYLPRAKNIANRKEGITGLPTAFKKLDKMTAGLQGGDLVLYVAELEKDGRTLKDVFIQQRSDDREQVWVAEKGYYWLDREQGMRYLTLENGQVTEGATNALDFRVMTFSRNDLRLPQQESRRKHKFDLPATPSRALLQSDQPVQQAELQWRISPAIAAVVLGLLAIPLSHSAPREGRGGRVLLGILAYVVYANLLYTSREWIARFRDETGEV